MLDQKFKKHNDLNKLGQMYKTLLIRGGAYYANWGLITAILDRATMKMLNIYIFLQTITQPARRKMLWRMSRQVGDKVWQSAVCVSKHFYIQEIYYPTKQCYRNFMPSQRQSRRGVLHQQNVYASQQKERWVPEFRGT